MSEESLDDVLGMPAFHAGAEGVPELVQRHPDRLPGLVAQVRVNRAALSRHGTLADFVHAHTTET